MGNIPIPTSVVMSYIQTMDNENAIVNQADFISKTTSQTYDTGYSEQQRKAYFTKLHKELSGSDQQLSLKELFYGMIDKTSLLVKRVPDQAYAFFRARYKTTSEPIPQEDFRRLSVQAALDEQYYKKSFSVMPDAQREYYYKLSYLYLDYRKEFPFLVDLYDHELLDKEKILNEHPEINEIFLNYYTTIKQALEKLQNQYTRFDDESIPDLENYYDDMYQRFAGEDGAMTFTELVQGHFEDSARYINAEYCDDFREILDKEPTYCDLYNAYDNKFSTH